MRRRSFGSVVGSIVVLAALAAAGGPTQAAGIADWAGRYNSDQVRIELIASGVAACSGAIHMGDQQFPLSARLEDGRLQGTFKSQGAEFPFTARLEGAGLTLVTGGTAFAVTREAPPPTNPLARPGHSTSQPAGPVNPLARAATPASAPAAGPVIAPAAEIAEYRHIDRRFTVRYPANWKLIRDIDESLVRYCFTPETSKTKAKDTDVSLSVFVMAEDASFPVAGKDPVTVLKHVLPMFRTAEPDIIPEGEVTSRQIGKLPAAHVAFRGKLKRKEGVFAGDLFVAREGDILYQIVMGAPEAQYPAYKPAMQQILDRSDFGRPSATRRGAEQSTSEIVSRYKDAVIAIEADMGEAGTGWGTGFIIHKNGYVASNAHVAIDLKTGKPALKYTAHWDQGTQRKTLPLELVGSLFQRNALNNHWARDVALFKLPAGEYPAVPLTPLGDVQLGDPIVTMGFPHGQIDFATLNLFTTRGVVTRFNRALDGKVDTLFIDAKITHGSSGGPCFSQVTGGAIGLNSYGTDISDNKLTNDLVGYNGVVPIDVLMERFPLQAELGLDPESDTIDFHDYYSLCTLYAQRRPQAAVEMARKAVALQPRSADANCLLGLCLLQSATSANDIKEAEEALNRSLACEADYQWALLTLSNLHLATGNLVKATQHGDRAVRAHADSFWAHYMQAQIYNTLKRYDDAIASINKARDLSHDVSAMPYILAGQIHYTQGNLDEGKAQFTRASQIHPTNLDARLGVGRYFELKQDFASALVEYGRIEVDLPDNPAVMVSMGRCYNTLKQHDDAFKQYNAALTRCELTGRTPQLEVFIAMGQIASDVKKNADFALGVYVKGLMYYGTTTAGADLHVRMARIFRDNKLPGLAFASLSRAASLQPESEEVKKELAAGNLPRTTLDDIMVLVKKLRFPEGIVADMISHTPLAFRTSIEELKKLIEGGLPVNVAVAIAESNKNFPPAQNEREPVARNQNPNGDRGVPQAEHGNVDPNGNPIANHDPNAGGNGELNGGENVDPNGNRNAAGPAALVGTWVTQIQTPYGGATMTVMLGQNGKYAIRCDYQSGQSAMDQGSWTLQQQQLVFRSNFGNVEVDRIVSFNGKVLEVEIPSAGTVRFTRSQAVASYE